jgi:CheY-like chemotaxis protein
MAAGGHELSVSLPERPVLLYADPVRLTQIFTNLLNNAAKYTPAGGRIWLAARQEGREAVVSVHDTGVGIPAEMLPRVFDLFTQVESPLDHARGGLGIGLALVQKLVALHGGRVEARSEGPGRGSEFIVRLPVANETAPAAKENSAPPAVLSAGTRILLVDDNTDAADSLGLLLESSGDEVRVVYDGPAALTAFAEFEPAVVILDLGMPGMTGYEVARRLRGEPGGRNATLIALTGWGQAADRRRSREAGFDHHLVKPVDFDALQQLLASLPKLREAGSP